MDWSFSGCGFLGVYHVGVASCLKEYSPQLVGRIYGASGGALAGCCLLCNSCLGEATTKLLGIVAKARSRSLGPLHPSFNINKVLRHGLNSVLPKNAHEIASGRLFISLTRISDAKNILISQFESKEDLIDALLCSSFIPLYCGFIPPTYKGVRYLDGGITDNQPIFDENTITISPFAGEQDICPIDNSHSLFCFDITNTNVQINSNNIYRLYCALFPPEAEVLSEMCKQGFDDTLRFLQRKSLMSCIRCLSVKAKLNLNQEKDRKKGGDSTRRRSWLEKTKAALLMVPVVQALPALDQSMALLQHQEHPSAKAPTFPPPITCTTRLIINPPADAPPPQSDAPQAQVNAPKKHKHGNGRCRDCRVPLVQPELERRFSSDKLGSVGSLTNGTGTCSKETNATAGSADPGDGITDAEFEATFMKNLPPVISNAFKAACQNMDRGLLNLLLKLPPMKLFAYYINVCLFPVDMFLHLTLRFLDWMPYLPGDMAWVFSHFIPLLRLFLKKIYDGKPDAKASLSCQLDVSEMNFYQDYKAAVKADMQDLQESKSTPPDHSQVGPSDATNFTNSQNGGDTIQQPAAISSAAPSDTKSPKAEGNHDAKPVDDAEGPNLSHQKNVNFNISLKWPKPSGGRERKSGKGDYNRRSSWYGTGPKAHKAERTEGGSSILEVAKTKCGSNQKYSSHPCLFEPTTPLTGKELPPVQHSGKNEAIMSYYYDDTEGHVKLTEIYDITRPLPGDPSRPVAPVTPSIAYDQSSPTFE